MTCHQLQGLHSDSWGLQCGLAALQMLLAENLKRSNKQDYFLPVAIANKSRNGQVVVMVQKMLRRSEGEKCKMA